MVIVDTSIWSGVLRRANDPAAPEVLQLIDHNRLAILGAIRQEVLSGIRDRRRFELLRDRLAPFPDVMLAEADYVEAAEMTCRAHGIQGSNTDFLICAAARRRSWAIFTNDAGFGRFAEHIPVTLSKATFSPEIP